MTHYHLPLENYSHTVFFYPCGDLHHLSVIFGPFGDNHTSSKKPYSIKMINNQSQIWWSSTHKVMFFLFYFCCCWYFGSRHITNPPLNTSSHIYFTLGCDGESRSHSPVAATESWARHWLRGSHLKNMNFKKKFWSRY